MSFESDLHKAEGLGSAKSGLSHWVAQRVTAIALIPLGVWMISAFLYYLSAPYEEAVQWLSSPWSASIATLFISIMFLHGYLGMQVILEDYVPNLPLRWALILGVKFLSALMALLTIFSIIRILIG